jgi:hypothetical protein
MITKGLAWWAKVKEPDSKYNNWSIVLRVSKEEAEKLKAVGLRVKMDEDDDGNIIRTWKCSRYVAKRGKQKGKGNNPAPTVVDAELNTFEGYIGNGSEVKVLHKPYQWNNSWGQGVGSDLQGVQILSLVEYVPEGGEATPAAIDDDGEGFSVEAGGFVAEKTEKEKKESVGDFDEDF